MPQPVVFSAQISPGRRLVRLLASALDPRAYLHLIRIVNFYNHTHVVPRRQIKFGHDCAVSPDVNFANGERILVGDRVRIGPGCHIWAGPSQGRIILGDDVLLGPEVLITVGKYDYNAGSPVRDQALTESDVVIGRDVWVGCRAMIMPGVMVGDGCIIGAGAIVTKNLPAGSVAVGAPAKIVGQRSVSLRDP